MNTFFSKNTPLFKFLRTMVQALIGLVIANADMIVSSLEIPDAYRPFIVPVVMAILAPIMAQLKKSETYDLETIEAENSLTLEEMETEGVDNDE